MEIFTKNFYISYAHTDQDWAKWIAARLEGAGYSVVLDLWDFMPGQNRIASMERALRVCERVIALLSPAYFEDRYAEVVQSVALQRHFSGENRSLLPIRIGECQPEGFLSTIAYLDLVGLDETTAAERLLDSFRSISPIASTRGHSINDSKPGFTLIETLIESEIIIKQIIWSPSGRMFASLLTDGTIRIWSTETSLPSHTFTTQIDEVNNITWSPDGERLAALLGDDTIQIYDVKAGTSRPIHLFTENSSTLSNLIWSPSKEILASSSADMTIKLWDAGTEQLLYAFVGHTGSIRSIVWSPDGELLASASDDRSIRVWSIETAQVLYTFTGHTDTIMDVKWFPNGEALVSSSNDGTIRVWTTKEERAARIIESPIGRINHLSFSSDGLFLASKSDEGIIGFWRTDVWAVLEIFNEPSHGWLPTLAFHPNDYVLAILSQSNTSIQLWRLSSDILLRAITSVSSVQYVNAKVVLVGDTGVGKTGLSLVLMGKTFYPTDSTHSRQVWTFSNEEVELGNQQTETHEILLWDLAGQPGYRLTHQFHLHEIALALVVFDARSETDPLAGVHHWIRTLRQIQRFQDNSAPPMKLFLVAARTDRGGVDISWPRIQSLKNDLGFDQYFNTSAKEMKNIPELIDAIKKAIDWKLLPRVSSTRLFQQIKTFLAVEKQTNRYLRMLDELYQAFLSSEYAPPEAQDFPAQFENCIMLLEAQGIIKILRFGNLILLQPELLDDYASALVIAVKDEPDGSGYIAETKVRSADFPIPEDKRIRNKEQEKLFTISMVEELLRQEIALREQLGDEIYLVFPSQSLREKPDLPNAEDPEGKTVIFTFEGSIVNIYTTLVVRVSHSGIFKKQDLWKNAVSYTTDSGGVYGIFLDSLGEGRGKLTLFFKAASEEICFLFENFVKEHLRIKALPGSVHQKRLFTCISCGFIVTSQLIRLKMERGLDCLTCPVCSNYISLLDREERFVARLSRVPEMNEHADAQRVIVANNFVVASIKEIHMEQNPGDTYNISGQAGAVGPESVAHDNVFNQIKTQSGDQIDLPSLAKELSTLRAKMREAAIEPEQDESIGAVATAEREAKNGNGPKALESLAKAGKWALDIAKEIGVKVAVEAIKAALGIK